MYYLDSVTQVKEMVRDRRRKRRLIQQTLDDDIHRNFGISKYSDVFTSQIAKSVIGAEIDLDSDTAYGVLARQVPGLSIEDVACYLLSVRLGLSPFSLAFTRDAFLAGSNDKLFRAKIPFVCWSKKGNLVINQRCVVSNSSGRDLTTLDMTRMDKLEVGNVSLPTFHRNMQQSVFDHFPTPNIWGDISSGWGEILARAKEGGKPPGTVWKCGSNHKDVNWEGSYSSEEARDLTVRPSSKWYYRLYLSIFLDGRFVLLDTYENESGGVPEARRLFEREMQAIHQATGFMPLVVRTYPLRPDMLYVNEHIVNKPAEAAQVLATRRYWSENTVSMTRWFADQAIHIGHS